MSFTILRISGPFPLGSRLCILKNRSEFFKFFVSGNILVLTQNSSMQSQLLSLKSRLQTPDRHALWPLSSTHSLSFWPPAPPSVHVVRAEAACPRTDSIPLTVSVGTNICTGHWYKLGPSAPSPGDSELGPKPSTSVFGWLNLKGSGFVNSHFIIT